MTLGQQSFCTAIFHPDRASSSLGGTQVAVRVWSSQWPCEVDRRVTVIRWRWGLRGSHLPQGHLGNRWCTQELEPALWPLVQGSSTVVCSWRQGPTPRGSALLLGLSWVLVKEEALHQVSPPYHSESFWPPNMWGFFPTLSNAEIWSGCLTM